MGVGGRIETDRQTDRQKTYGQTDRQTEKEEIVSKQNTVKRCRCRKRQKEDKKDERCK